MQLPLHLHFSPKAQKGAGSSAGRAHPSLQRGRQLCAQPSTFGSPVLGDQTHGWLSHTHDPAPLPPPAPQPLWGAWPLLPSSVDVPLLPASPRMRGSSLPSLWECFWHAGCTPWFGTRAEQGQCPVLCPGGSSPGTGTRAGLAEQLPGAACPATFHVEPRTTGRGIVEGEQGTGGHCSGWGQGPGPLLCGSGSPCSRKGQCKGPQQVEKGRGGTAGVQDPTCAQPVMAAGCSQGMENRSGTRQAQDDVWPCPWQGQLSCHVPSG